MVVECLFATVFPVLFSTICFLRCYTYVWSVFKVDLYGTKKLEMLSLGTSNQQDRPWGSRTAPQCKEGMSRTLHPKGHSSMGPERYVGTPRGAHICTESQGLQEAAQQVIRVHPSIPKRTCVSALLRLTTGLCFLYLP